MGIARPTKHGGGETLKQAPGRNITRGRLKTFSIPKSGPSLPYFVNDSHTPVVGSDVPGWKVESTRMPFAVGPGESSQLAGSRLDANSKLPLPIVASAPKPRVETSRKSSRSRSSK